MSLVIGIVTSNSAHIFSDGRVRTTDNNIVITEQYDKTRMINRNVIMGFTGGREFGELILHCFHTDTPAEIIQNMTVEVVADKLCAIAKKMYPKYKTVTSMTLAGIDSNRNMRLCSFGSEYNFEMKTLVATDNVVHFTTLSPEGDYSDYFNNMLTSCKSLLLAIKETYYYAAQQDNSINTTLFHQNIQKLF